MNLPADTVVMIPDIETRQALCNDINLQNKIHIFALRGVLLNCNV